METFGVLISAVTLTLLLHCPTCMGGLTGVALLKHYIYRLNGELLACPIEVYKRKPVTASEYRILYESIKTDIDELSRYVAGQGFKFRVVMPPKDEYQSTLAAFAKIGLKNIKPGKDMAEFDKNFWDSREPIFTDGGDTVFQQLQKKHGCEISMLFLPGNHPQVRNTGGIAIPNALCGGNSRMIIRESGSYDWEMYLKFQGLFTVIGVTHTDRNPPYWVTNYNPNDLDGEGKTMIGYLKHGCSKPLNCGRWCDHRHFLPQYFLDGCSKIAIAVQAYLNDRGLSKTVQCLLD